MRKVVAAPTTRATTDKQQADHIKPATKVERVLIALLTRGSLNRVEAEKAPIFDHSLNSTMSCEVGRRLGLTFTSTPEKCTGYAGQPARYHRYAFQVESIAPAQDTVNALRRKRGAEPINWAKQPQEVA